MNHSTRQPNPGSWELTIDLVSNPSAKAGHQPDSSSGR